MAEQMTATTFTDVGFFKIIYGSAHWINITLLIINTVPWPVFFSGIAPTHFMRQWRVNQSRRLLLQGHPIGNIALDCGFSSQAYFGKCFKQQFSMTPSEYLSLKNRDW